MSLLATEGTATALRESAPALDSACSGFLSSTSHSSGSDWLPKDRPHLDG
jgi:hypothetical protein